MLISRFLRRVRAWFPAPVLARPEASSALPRPTAESQLLLSLQYRQLRHTEAPLPRLRDVGFRVYSESDKDGILHYIFSLIGAKNRLLVDISASKLEGSNTANLLINRGWTGLLVDGRTERVKGLRDFYAACPETRNYPPRCVAAWATAENVNDVVREAGPHHGDCLPQPVVNSVDVDRQEIDLAPESRVVVVAYQCILGPERSVSVPYRPDFTATFDGPYATYNSASLAAFIKLGRSKGYRLVGCQRYGYNAFFVREDLDREELPEVSAHECFEHPFPQWAMTTFFDRVKDRGRVEV